MSQGPGNTGPNNTVTTKKITPVASDNHKTLADTFASLPTSGQLAIANRHNIIEPSDGTVVLTDFATQQKLLRRIREKGITEDVVNTINTGLRN